MICGVDYYPEQWPRELLEEDLRRIVELGANTIRIGEFAWHLIENIEGCFDFSYFDYVIDRAESHGLRVVYGTPTATFPAWLAKKYPSILSEDSMGNKRVFGGRRQYCYNSDEYLEASLKMVRRLVSHYSSNQNVFMWQVDNEFGHEGSDECFCMQCREKFWKFLKNKYKEISKLNEIYGTIFWGQSYNEFEEIPLPLKTITTHNPTLKLDWARFRSESINSFAKKHVDCIRENKGSHQEVTHNFFGGYFDLKYDQNVMSEELDLVSYDNYPVWGGLKAPLSPAQIAMGHDYMRGLKQKNFWVMEQLIGAQGHDDIGYLPREGESSLWATQAMTRGCEAIFYFRYRGAIKGQEQYCQGILDADNRINAKYKEVQSFFKWATCWEDYFLSSIKAKAAIIYDYDNRHSWMGQRQSDAFNYTKEILRFYNGFFDSSVAVDIIDIKKDWSFYKILVMPIMQLVDECLAKRLVDFVEKGGILIAGYRQGIKDFDNNLIFGQKPPCFMQSLFGVEVEEYEALGEGIIAGIESEGQITGIASVWRDLLRVTEASTIYSYEKPYQRYTAASVNSFGKGAAYYIGAGLDEELMRNIIKDALRRTSIEAISTPKGIELVAREFDGKTIYFAMNHSHHNVSFKNILFDPISVKVLDEKFEEIRDEDLGR